MLLHPEEGPLLRVGQRDDAVLVPVEREALALSDDLQIGRPVRHQAREVLLDPDARHADRQVFLASGVDLGHLVIVEHRV
jgi:hypothetical protein